MQDTAYRLTYSLTYKGFSIVDNLSGNSILNKDGVFQAFTLDKDKVLICIENIIEALSTYSVKRKVIGTRTAPTEKLHIVEKGHFEWSLKFENGARAVISDQHVSMDKAFDLSKVRSLLNKVKAEIISADKILEPKTDIVRRVADAGLLVWVYKGHSIVCYESSIKGAMMNGCLVDGTYYPVAIVSASEEEGKTYLMTPDLQEIITYPLDDSIKFFYKPDDHVFDMTDEEVAGEEHI